MPGLFKDEVLGRGIAGQTTMQMLDRFRSDVIDLHPQVVHILAGANDIAGLTGPTRLGWIEANLQTDDGVHPNPAGYALMTPLAQKAIAQALSRPAP